MRSAIRRRKPMILISDVSAETSARAGTDGAAGPSSRAGGLVVATAAVLAALLATAPAPSLTSNTISGEPTATLSPGAPVIDTTRPLTGAGTSTAALSVITSTMS